MWRRWRRWRHGRRCRQLAASCGEPALARYLETCSGLAVDRIDNTPLIAVDLELTGREATATASSRGLNRITALDPRWQPPRLSVHRREQERWRSAVIHERGTTSPGHS
jgi:hypothetical protein